MPSEISAGDTAWVLASAALVMLMTPGLALFYGGLVRPKNVLSTLMHSFFILGLISVQWVLWGYSLAFGPSVGGFIGSLGWIGPSTTMCDSSAYCVVVRPDSANCASQWLETSRVT